jgi:ComF family protein
MSTREINGAIWAVSYGPVIRKILYQFKYKPYLSKLASVIGEILTEGISQNESLYAFIGKYKPVVLAVSLNEVRLRERGYNHAELLASYVAQYFKLKLISGVLIRIKNTKPQYKLNKEQRRRNIIGAFEISKSAKVPENIILVDDIATSFSTLREAAKILKKRGAKRVLGITFAREI